MPQLKFSKVGQAYEFNFKRVCSLQARVKQLVCNWTSTSCVGYPRLTWCFNLLLSVSCGITHFSIWSCILITSCYILIKLLWRFCIKPNAANGAKCAYFFNYATCKYYIHLPAAFSCLFLQQLLHGCFVGGITNCYSYFWRIHVYHTVEYSQLLGSGQDKLHIFGDSIIQLRLVQV